MSETSGERIRAADADRDRVVEQLRAHHEAGRLDAEEFNQRMESALLARYLDELPPLLIDLPRGDEKGSDGESRERPDFGPPWAWRGSRVPRFFPLAAVVTVLVVIGSLAAIAHGHFPFPLLLLGFGLLWLGKWRSWHRYCGHGYGGHGYGGHRHGWEREEPSSWRAM